VFRALVALDRGLRAPALWTDARNRVHGDPLSQGIRFQFPLPPGDGPCSDQKPASLRSQRPVRLFPCAGQRRQDKGRGPVDRDRTAERRVQDPLRSFAQGRQNHPGHLPWQVCGGGGWHELSRREVHPARRPARHAGDNRHPEVLSGRIFTSSFIPTWGSSPG